MFETKLILPTFKVLGQANICSYKNFEPVIYDNGLGFEADLLKAICKLWGVEASFHPCEDYKNIWNKPSEEGSRFDIIAAGLDPNCHNDTGDVVFSIPTANYSQSLLILRKFHKTKIVDFYSFERHELKIGVLGNTSGEVYGRQRANALRINLSIFKRYETEKDLIKALDAEEIHGIARGTIGNEFQELKNNKYITIEKKSFGETLAYVIDPKNKQLKLSLDEGIRLLTDDNAISYQEWLANPNVFTERLE